MILPYRVAADKNIFKYEQIANSSVNVLTNLPFKAIINISVAQNYIERKMRRCRKMSIYDFKVKAQDGSEVNLSDYKDKVLLIVNTATGCGFTPQYDELQDLYELHQNDGLEILDFPCNQFADQAPGSDEEIHSFCTGRYGITFPQFSKIDVLGENADPLFKYLSENTKFEGFGKSPMTLILSGVVKKMDKDYKNNGNIKWNFTKFLIDRNGEIKARFEPTASLKDVQKKVEEVL